MRNARKKAPAETRNPRTRWQNLISRGGHPVSFTPTGFTVPIDLDAPDAENTLAWALSNAISRTPHDS